MNFNALRLIPRLSGQLPSASPSRPKPDDVGLLEAMGREEEDRRRLKEQYGVLQTKIEEAAKQYEKYPQMVLPQRKEASWSDVLFTGAGDLLADLFSRAPRSQRVQRTPSIERLRMVRDARYQDDLKASDVAYNNESQRLLASQRAAEARLKGAEAGVGAARDDLGLSREDTRFGKTFGLETARFKRGIDESDRDYDFRRREADRNAQQFQRSLGWEKERFYTTDYDLASRDVEKAVKNGMPREQAEARFYGKWMLSETQNKMADLDLKTAQEMFKVLPQKIADTLGEYEYNKRMRPLNLAAMRRNLQGGQQTSAVDSQIARLSTVMDGILMSRTNLAAKGGKDTDPEVYSKFYIQKVKDMVGLMRAKNAEKPGTFTDEAIAAYVSSSLDKAGTPSYLKESIVPFVLGG